MREESGQIQGGSISGELMLRGQILGSAAVVDGAHLRLLGQVTENLVIEEGGSAEVFGMVCGDLINRGKLELAGVVVGRLLDESGTATVSLSTRIGDGDS